MDPLSAIGLAGNILQFVDSIPTLVGQGVEIYRSAVGATAVHTDLRASIERLDALSKPFRRLVVIPRDEDEAQIVKTAVACNTIGRDLANALDKLAATPHSCNPFGSSLKSRRQSKNSTCARTIYSHYSAKHCMISNHSSSDQSTT